MLVRCRVLMMLVRCGRGWFVQMLNVAARSNAERFQELVADANALRTALHAANNQVAILQEDLEVLGRPHSKTVPPPASAHVSRYHQLAMWHPPFHTVRMASFPRDRMIISATRISRNVDSIRGFVLGALVAISWE